LKKFRFRLETPLRLRRRKEEKCSQDLAKARSEVLLARQGMDRLEKERAVWAAAPLLDETGALDLARDQCRRDYVEQLDFRIQDAQETLGQLAHQVTLRETALRNAVRDRQILERLKDIRQKTHIEEIRALEMKRMDFAASSIFRRSNP
jgi:flagellar export protein FliJ